MKKHVMTLLAICLAWGAAAQYNENAGRNTAVEKKVSFDKDGQEVVEYQEVEAARDEFNNASGNQYDLAVDGAFEGQTIVVLHLYTGEGFDFSYPKAALAEKGFSVYRYLNQPPSAQELAQKLDSACQLWVISDRTNKLNSDHLGVIREFFNSGKGLYVWGDNQPYYADANLIAQEIFGTTMQGNIMGDQTIGVHRPDDTTKAKSGIVLNHLLSTGIENMYEGITIATVQENDSLTPLIYGSSGNQVAAYYDRAGKRAIFDGGFTRLFVKWHTAGTARYVKNAASWLVNYERFGNDVLGMDTDEDVKQGDVRPSHEESKPIGVNQIRGEE